eukprot:CAMPEP_0172764186 /NCGR_PEP_ID=MMETSP1074-20121228/176796_1 /TAXON_ID=2916 /ORGANISM="Ceratium fusus, Strain PA161109" /LENGTH=131 /DNA_ID=CAMNT_0013598909 /DNA_START=66 /DNA_END=458 /DNA_ORIENTATION=-
MLVAPLRVLRAHFCLIIHGNAIPVNVRKVLTLESKEVVIPIDAATSWQTIAHGAIAMRMEVIHAKIEGTTRPILEAMQKILMCQRCTIPATPYAVTVERVLNSEARVQYDVSLVLPVCRRHCWCSQPPELR